MTGPSSAQSGTRFATSRDGTRIAYEVSGAGPAVMLLHGGGQTRRVWRDAGYVERLMEKFTVITVDLRGNGESDKPSEASAYAIDRVTQDLFAVADAAGARTFAIWGFSYGANIGRYLASRSERVRAMVYIGIPFGAAAPDDFRQYILATRAKWQPIVDAARAGTLDLLALSAEDRKVWQGGTVPASLASLSAMLDYPSVEPRDMVCPTLWVVGTSNPGATASAKEFEAKLVGTRVTIARFEGLTHLQELERIDLVLARELEFMRSNP